jgi:glycosyltransferase involved in cell wall biosynthesis
MAENLGLTKHLSFLGFLDDVSSVFAHAHIYISASSGEGLPLTLLEAMAHSVPVVASNVTGNNDLILHGDTGFLFDLENLNSARDSILRLLRERDCRSWRQSLWTVQIVTPCRCANVGAYRQVLGES